MIYLQLALEFFKIGLFSFGGGYATLPFLYHIAEKHNWYSINELSYMTGIASITPGPVGINIATYAGLKTSGILGSVIATISEVIPSLILVIIMSKILNKFYENFYIKSLIDTLKPISCALLISVSFGLISIEKFNIYSISLLALFLLFSWKNKKDPIFYILIAGIFGALRALF